MTEVLLLIAGLPVVFALGYRVGRDEGYVRGRRDGWMQYDNIVPEIRDEAERLFGEPRGNDE